MKGQGELDYFQRKMETKENIQRAVIIMDASKEIAFSALSWCMKCLHLKSGDALHILRIVYDVQNAGQQSPTDANMNLNSKLRKRYAKLVIDKIIENKKNECLSNIQVELIRRECDKKKIHFGIEVRAGTCAKLVGLQTAKELKATWIILDSYIKKEMKHFMDNLVCSVAKVRRNNKIKVLRGYTSPDTKPTDGYLLDSRKRTSFKQVESRQTPDTPVLKTIYEETPRPVGERPEALFSLEISPLDQITFIKDNSIQEFPLMVNIVPSSGFNQPSFSYSDLLQFPVKGRDHEGLIEDSPNVKTMVEINSTVAVSNLKSTQASLKSAKFCSICKSKPISLVLGQDFIRFTYAQLAEATDNFSHQNCLSSGGPSLVYRGRLKQGLYVAIKQHKYAYHVPKEDEFRCEVEAIRQAQHRYLVRLVGYCLEEKHRLLVYEYVCNGSLHSNLYGNNAKALDWKHRRKIAIGAARGLRYLHQKCRGTPIVYGGLSLNKILLTHDFEPLLGDFGLAHRHVEPEGMHLEVSNDVYAFGVILLQLISGRRAIDNAIPSHQQSIVQWARPFIKEFKYLEILDRRIQYPEDYDKFCNMVHAAALCLEQNPLERPSMSMVVHILEGDISVFAGNNESLRFDSRSKMPCSRKLPSPLPPRLSYSSRPSASSTSEVKEICDAKVSNKNLERKKLLSPLPPRLSYSCKPSLASMKEICDAKSSNKSLGRKKLISPLPPRLSYSSRPSKSSSTSEMKEICDAKDSNKRLGKNKEKKKWSFRRSFSYSDMRL